MIDVFKQNLKLLEKINKESKKRAASFADIQYVKEEIKEFESKWLEFQSFLSDIDGVDPCDAEQFDSIHSKSWEIWSNLNSLIDEFEELIRTIRKNYIPPCPEAVLEYKMGARNTPLYLAKLEEELEPLNNLKVKQAYFKYEQIFSLKIIPDGFITQNAYDEIYLLNNDLLITKKFCLVEPPQSSLAGYNKHSYKKFNSQERIYIATSEEYDDQCRVFYLDCENDNLFEILDDGLNWENPNKIYYWQGDELIIFKDDTFYSINPYRKKVKSVSLNEIKSELPDFYNYITQSFNYKILSVDPEKYIFIYRDIENLEIGIKNTKENTTQKIKFYNEEVYDVKIHGDYVMFIEESRIDVRKGNSKRTLIYPDPGSHFNTANFFEQNDKLFISTLDETNALGVSCSVAIYEIADSFDKLIADNPKDRSRLIFQK